MSTEARPGSGEMFDAIADRYDLLNRIISLGVDQSWRDRAVRALELSGSAQVLDVATGTADLAIRIARALPEARVVGVDPSTRMLEIGRGKLRELELDARVELAPGSVEALPYPDASFDGTTIAFGIRNAHDRAQGLCEMRRVTRPGGRVVVLELGEPDSGPLATLARWHIHSVVPWVGGMLSGKAEYDYLQRSIAAFPSRSAFQSLMADAGLEVERAEPLTFGVATLFVGKVP
ncbi:MAG: bifunctional demethylmenaquinone methyltransferase/2-methoxy-6-polyprenyl-1,4-benzoquinol methylase UbiE [Myxococcales bacterium]|nr:bifunctional demethylmenaquinone methyltransferase/2-methoxy-6-polyprenyl-1,4-benzoquinol methylase UbiE [Myxococcales bacterium]